MQIKNKEQHVAKNDLIILMEKTSLICVQKGEGVWQEGCLVKTCNSGTVEERLATECVELIEMKVEEILGERLAEKGWLQHIVTKISMDILVCMQVLNVHLKMEELLRLENTRPQVKINDLL